jgi:hypothetical protein
LNTIERELKHRTFGESDERLVKSEIQFTEGCHLLGTRGFCQSERGRRFYELSLDAAGPVELRGISHSPRCQTGGQTLQRTARLDGVSNILTGEDARRISTVGQLFQQPFLMQLFERCASYGPGRAEAFRKFHLFDGLSRGQFTAQDHLAYGNQHLRAA